MTVKKEKAFNSRKGSWRLYRRPPNLYSPFPRRSGQPHLWRFPTRRKGTSSDFRPQSYSLAFPPRTTSIGSGLWGFATSDPIYSSAPAYPWVTAHPWARERTISGYSGATASEFHGLPSHLSHLAFSKTGQTI